MITEKIKNRHRVVIIQHPQEKREPLASAPVLLSRLQNCDLRVGLSWPNLNRALGEPGANPKQWCVLFLGRGIENPEKNGESASFVSRKGHKLDFEATGKARGQIQGIIALDGTWSQAKTLWWRNPWLLKLTRLVLSPANRSLYGNLRKEPRPDCLSTLESVAVALTFLGENKSVESDLLASFQELLSSISRKRT